MDKRIQPTISALKTELQALYGDRFRGLYLYGSYARGTQRPSSDIDIAYILDSFDRPAIEIARTNALVARLSLDLDITISLIPVRQSDLKGEHTLLARSVAREGLAV